MKVARLYDFLDIRLEDQDAPRAGAGEMVVRTRACGICSGDVMDWYIRTKAPVVFGHEPAGEVVEVGQGVEGVRPGDRVFVHHHAPCLSCRACRRGDFVQCATWRSSRIVPGAMAEYFLVPKENVAGDTLRLGPHVSFEEGALVEPTACAVKSLRRARLRGGETMLVIGLGIMGQLHVALGRSYGAERILGTDFVPYRRQKALELGADEALDAAAEDLVERVREATKGEMADTVIVGPGTTAAMETGIRCAGRGATVVLFTASPPDAALGVFPYRLYFDEISIVPSYSCGPNDTREALRLVESGAVPAQKLVTHRFPFSQVGEAYRVAAEARDSLKTIVIFP